MNLFDELNALGVDVEEGKERLMGNASLYKRMLEKYGDMMKEPSIRPDFRRGIPEEILKGAHTLKGVTGNLSLTPLYEGYSQIVRLLREEQMEEAEAVYEKLLPVQEKILKCIEKYR